MAADPTPLRAADAQAQPSLPDARGSNLFEADPSFRALLSLYLEPKLFAHLRYHARP